jgi:hypothetical protein
MTSASEQAPATALHAVKTMSPLVALLALVACSLMPMREIASFKVVTDMRRADALLRDLAKHNDTGLNGKLVGPSTRHPPENTEASITGHHCLFMARKRGQELTVSLLVTEGHTCPPRMIRIFDQARGMLASN